MARSRRRIGRRLEDVVGERSITVPRAPVLSFIAPAAPLVLGEPGGDGGVLGTGALGGPAPVRKGRGGRGKGKGRKGRNIPPPTYGNQYAGPYETPTLPSQAQGRGIGLGRGGGGGGGGGGNQQGKKGKKGGPGGRGR